MIIARLVHSGTNKVVVDAPAKVNLFLEVTGCRANGYHDIRSVVVPVDIRDTLMLERTDGPIEIRVRNGKGIQGAGKLARGRPEDNLATKAAVALREATGVRAGVKISLTKRIPVGGGLGGGSADAAAVLVGLNTLWRAGLSREALAKLGTRIGCDVPALIHGGSVVMTGLGEALERLPVIGQQAQDGWWIVMANPGFSVSTGDIYSRCSCALTSQEDAYRSIVSALETGDVRLAAAGLFNGLQPTVFRKYPVIRILAEALETAGALGVLLSGSGASLFGLARDRSHARQVAAEFGKTLGFSVWTKIARTLPDSVMVAHGPLEARV